MASLSECLFFVDIQQIYFTTCVFLASPACYHTCVAALVHHQHVGSDADHAAHLTLELPVGQTDRTG